MYKQEYKRKQFGMHFEGLCIYPTQRIAELNYDDGT